MQEELFVSKGGGGICLYLATSWRLDNSWISHMPLAITVNSSRCSSRSVHQVWSTNSKSELWILKRPGINIEVASMSTNRIDIKAKAVQEELWKTWTRKLMREYIPGFMPGLCGPSSPLLQQASTPPPPLSHTLPSKRLRKRSRTELSPDWFWGLGLAFYSKEYYQGQEFETFLLKKLNLHQQYTLPTTHPSFHLILLPSSCPKELRVFSASTLILLKTVMYHVQYYSIIFRIEPNKAQQQTKKIDTVTRQRLEGTFISQIQSNNTQGTRRCT